MRSNKTTGTSLEKRGHELKETCPQTEKNVCTFFRICTKEKYISRDIKKVKGRHQRFCRCLPLIFAEIQFFYYYSATNSKSSTINLLPGAPQNLSPSLLAEQIIAIRYFLSALYSFFHSRGNSNSFHSSC